MGRRDISEHGRVVPVVYSSTALRGAPSEIADDTVFECPYEPEQYVITELTAVGDTHGWHWDDYSFALVWVIDCPPVEHGGFVQCVRKRRGTKPIRNCTASSSTTPFTRWSCTVAICISCGPARRFTASTRSPAGVD